MKKEEIKERRKRVKELHEQGKNSSEIARILKNVSQETITRDKKWLKMNGEIEDTKKSTGTKIKRLCGKFYGQPEIEKIFNQYILECKEKLKQNTLEREEIVTIKDVVTLVDKYENSVFYIKACIKFGQVEEAMKFVNNQISNDSYTKEQKEKMKELKEKVQKIKKKYIAIKILKKEEGVEQAVKYSGLSEVEVIRLHRKLIEKGQEIKRKKEENDDGEEQNI